MNAPFAWPGGKRGLLKILLERIPKHSLYVEVFSGSAKLLFAKPPSSSEIINDLNGEVANFYRVVKHRGAELAEVLEQDVIHPERFRDLSQQTSDDELSRALRFVYTTWYSYGAKGEHFARPSLAESLRGQVRRPLDTVRGLLTATGERLRRVRIEQRDFAEMLLRFDSPETFFYLDPPYVHYQPNGRYDALSIASRVEMFKILAGIEGAFLMSFDDCVEVRKLVAEHRMDLEEVETRYGLGSTKESRGVVVELLVSNVNSHRDTSHKVVDVDLARVAQEGTKLGSPTLGISG